MPSYVYLNHDFIQPTDGKKVRFGPNSGAILVELADSRRALRARLSARYFL